MAPSPIPDAAASTASETSAFTSIAALTVLEAAPAADAAVTFAELIFPLTAPSMAPSVAPEATEVIISLTSICSIFAGSRIILLWIPRAEAALIAPAVAPAEEASAISLIVELSTSFETKEMAPLVVALLALFATISMDSIPTSVTSAICPMEASTAPSAVPIATAFEILAKSIFFSNAIFIEVEEIVFAVVMTISVVSILFLIAD